MEIYIEREEKLKNLFLPLSKDEKYIKIIQLGKDLPSMDPIFLTQNNLVTGCQSLLYLVVSCQENILHINAHSDALISRGLAALLIELYNGLSPISLWLHPPTVLKDIDLFSSLSPTRIVGFSSLFNKLQIEAKKYINDYS